MSLDQIALLFGRDKSVIYRHIKNIFEINELEEISCVAFFATELNKYDPRTGKMRKTKVDIKLFNLDVIISVGYRVNSIMGVMRQQITRFENMSNSPTIFFLVKYANALDTELDVILNGVDLIGVTNNE